MRFQAELPPVVMVTIGSKLIAVCQARAVVPSMGFEPVEQGADAHTCHGDDMVRAAIVEAQRVSIRQDGVTAREDHVAYVTNPFVILFRTHDPLITANDAGFG